MKVIIDPFHLTVILLLYLYPARRLQLTSFPASILIAILISCWLSWALHAEKFEIFRCPDCKMAALIAFFRGSLLLDPSNASPSYSLSTTFQHSNTSLGSPSSRPLEREKMGRQSKGQEKERLWERGCITF